MPKIRLSAYVERIKNLTLDPWQINLCARLEKSFWLSRASLFEFQEVNLGTGPAYVVAPSGFKILKTEFDAKKGKGTRAAIHAPPQFGKSIIISQAYPAWILGYDPIHRFRLATYNMLHSARFSGVIRQILYSPEHKAIFLDPGGHLPPRCKFAEWSTYARLALNDGQGSFAALGLQSGLTGTGYETLLCDDPYKSAEEARSQIIRDKTWRFHTDQAAPRAEEHSNEYIMFHRYHQDDMGGHAISSGDFELWWYPAQEDGNYVDDETGLQFAPAFKREPGEYLSPRRSPEYYEKQKSNKKVWLSQFMGKPTDDEGEMFNVGMLTIVEKMPQFLHKVRAWDNAFTEGAGDWTVGARMGIEANGRVCIVDVKREQVDTAGREALQLQTATEDGKLVPQHAPQDPAAGKDVAFKFRQMLAAEGFQAETTPVAKSKPVRAHNFSIAVNSGNASMLEAAWNKVVKNELKFFPLGTFDDIVDALADAYNYLMKLFYHGLVIKRFNEFVHPISRQKFFVQFGDKEDEQNRLPEIWDAKAAIRISPDSSKPSGWAITARAPDNAKLGECIIVVASAKRYTAEPGELIQEMQNAIQRYLVKRPATVWLSRESAAIGALAMEKHNLRLSLFKHDVLVGIPEFNSYVETEERKHPFFERNEASKLYLLSHDDQLGEPIDEGGQVSARQEAVTWSYNEKEEPQPFGGIVLDCVRMMLYNFALKATPRTREERLEDELPDDLKLSKVLEQRGTKRFATDMSARTHALGQLAAEDDAKRKAEADKIKQLLGHRPTHGKYRRNR